MPERWSMASASEVLPTPPWPTSTTFLTLPVLGAPMMTSLQGRAQCATPTGRVRGRCRPGSSMVGSRADSPSKCPMASPYPHGRPSMHTFRHTYEYRRREDRASMPGDYLTPSIQIRTTLKKGGLLLGYNPRAPGSRLKARARTSSRPSAS